MVAQGVSSVFAGAIILGAVHGIEPGHGWPVAASYALDRGNKWFYGLAASLILGIGHLISSIAMVGVFFYAKDYFQLTQLNEPLVVWGDIQIGGPISLVAGVLLIGLGIREYRHGHSHGGHSHGGHSHSDGLHGHDHSTGEDESNEEFPYRTVDSHVDTADTPSEENAHSHTDSPLEHTETDRGLLGIAWFAFVLGFAHEEEFEIIALCAGSTYCLELMGVYALTVIAGIVSFTLLLIAGYHTFEAKVERVVPYLPAFSAAVLVVMGLGFITGLF